MGKKEIEEITKQLNKEYCNLGSIEVKEASKQTIRISELLYVTSIMDNVEALDVNKPIIVGKEWSELKLIDGYHRLKNYINKGIKEIEVVILEDYRIYRKDDELFSFMSGLVGKEIYFYDSHTFSLDNKVYYIKENEGCGGCGNGWSSFELLPEYLKKKVRIKSVKSENGEYDDYKLYINGKLFANVDTGWGNGFYGGDFEIVH